LEEVESEKVRLAVILLDIIQDREPGMVLGELSVGATLPIHYSHAVGVLIP